MTTKKPQAFDKTGEELDVGDTVELVYGGDTHIAKIDDLVDEGGTILVLASVTAAVPHGGTRKVDPKTKQPDNSRRRSAD
jgi:hypothetical protein